ncbi:Nucleoporin NUP53 [Galdieria sulphuraria]|nr:Nucleoporin NUP53 [Galdieria sulphuraria]
MDYQRQSEFENARTSPVRTPVQYGFQSPVETPRENKKQLLNVFLTGGLPTQQFSPLESRSLVRGETSVKRTSNSGRNEDYVPPTQLKTKDKWSADRNTPKGRAPPRYSLLEESETNSGSASKDLSFRTVASPQLRNQFERTEPSLSPRSEGTSCWVTVFGFGPSLQAAVLREFRNYGEIAQMATGKRIHMVAATTMQIKEVYQKPVSIWTLLAQQQDFWKLFEIFSIIGLYFQLFDDNLEEDTSQLRHLSINGIEC